ncbi:MAG: adenosylmethionine-8-amino-7-oxononanoate aminotransferase [Gammaproteobacteria bacterium]
MGRPKKKTIISRQKAYHGSTYLAASLGGNQRDKDWMDVASGGVIVPLLIITAAQIDEMFDILAEGIRLTTQDLKREGLWPSDCPDQFGGH